MTDSLFPPAGKSGMLNGNRVFKKGRGFEMKRTRLSDRTLPDYTRGEEIFNMVSHIVGGAFGILTLVLCVARSALRANGWGVASSLVYGVSMILLYTMSCIYHGLIPVGPKKVMQVLDHCTIYYLIAGTYTPILLCAIRRVSPAWAWALFGVVWACAVTATVFTAIDLKKYSVFSMICYLAMGWCIVFAIRPALAAIPLPGLGWILWGGIAYTAGAVLYGLGRKHRWMHSIFHLFVLLGSVLQFVGIYLYVL